MLEELQELGFSPNEIKVYESLLKVGETPVGGIINDLKVHGQIVYNALDGLEKRGLVSKTIKNKVYHFKVSDPEIILENIKKQELIASRMTQIIKSEMGKTKFENSINIYTGQDGLRKRHLEIFKKIQIGGVMRVLQANTTRYGDVYGVDFLAKKIDPIRVKKNISSQIIVGKNFKDENKEFLKKVNSNIRHIKYLPYNTIDPIMTQIFDNHVMFVSTGKEIFSIDIENEELYNSYLNHFKVLWEMAKD